MDGLADVVRGRVRTAGLADAIEELYANDPATFIDRREELSKQARTAGAPEVARSITALRRPTRSAWLVNRFARSDSELIEQLVRVGDELRAAQSRLDGAALRELTPRRRAVISAAAGAALRGERVSEAVRSEVTSTLEAALVDPGVATEVAAGRLTRAVEWSSFGEAGPAAPNTAVERKAARLKEWQDGLDEAQTETDEADAAVRAAQDRRTAATKRIEELEEKLGQARLDLRAAGSQHRSAQTRAAAARRRSDRIRRDAP